MSGEWTEQNNSGKFIVNTKSEGSNGTYPLLLLLLLFYFLCCCCIDCLKIITKTKWNCNLAENERNKRTAETLIVNMPSEGSNGTYPLLLLLFFLCCWFADCLKINAKQKWKWRWVENGRNKLTEKALIVNIPSGDWTALTLCCCCFCCSIFCAVSADIVSIKTVPLNF